jgi:hypothetical protein
MMAALVPHKPMACPKRHNPHYGHVLMLWHCLLTAKVRHSLSRCHRSCRRRLRFVQNRNRLRPHRY